MCQRNAQLVAECRGHLWVIAESGVMAFTSYASFRFFPCLRLIASLRPGPRSEAPEHPKITYLRACSLSASRDRRNACRRDPYNGTKPVLFSQQDQLFFDDSSMISCPGRGMKVDYDPFAHQTNLLNGRLPLNLLKTCVTLCDNSANAQLPHPLAGESWNEIRSNLCILFSRSTGYPAPSVPVF